VGGGPAGSGCLTLANVIVLDCEAAQAIADAAHPKHSDALAYAEVVEQRKRKHRPCLIVIPTCVRAEACLDHQDRESTLFNRIGVVDVPLDKATASTAAGIRRALGTQVSVTDAHIGATVLRKFRDDDLAILTSDPDDMALVTQPADVTILKL
jgi:hypothetical protein